MRCIDFKSSNAAPYLPMTVEEFLDEATYDMADDMLSHLGGKSGSSVVLVRRNPLDEELHVAVIDLIDDVRTTNIEYQASTWYAAINQAMKELKSMKVRA